MSGELEEAVSEFVEQLGLHAEAEGLPRTAGRIMGLMLVCEGPYTLDELQDELQISRGSASTNTRRLEELGVVERTTRPGDRRVYFRLTDDPYGRIVESRLERMRKIQEVVDRSIERIPDEYEKGKRRLDYMRRFYQLIVEETDALIREWRERDVQLE